MNHSRLLEIAKQVSSLKEEARLIIEEEMKKTLPQRQKAAEQIYKQAYERNMIPFLNKFNGKESVNAKNNGKDKRIHKQ